MSDSQSSYPKVNKDGIHIGLVKNITDERFTLVMTREQAIRLLGEENVSKAEKNRLHPTTTIKEGDI